MKPDDTHQLQAACDALLAGHALGDLDEEERQRLAALLREQPALRQRLEEFSTTLELLPLGLPATASAPQRLRSRLIRTLAIQPTAPRQSWLAPALLTLVLLMMGLELHQTRQQLAQLQQQIAAPAAHTALSRRLSLRAVDPNTRASGEVLITGNATNNVLMLNDLPPPPPEHIYRLWARVNGQEVGCIYFQPTAQGHVAMLIPTSPTSEATSVSISVETDPLGVAPTGPRVLSSSL